MKRVLVSTALIAVVFAAGFLAGQQKTAKSAAPVGQPKTIVHFVTLKWRADVPPAERQKAIEGIRVMASKIPGIKNVWLKTLRVQPQDFHAVYAIEFVNQDAADDYRDHPAHQEWEKSYLSMRDNSLSMQATN